MKKIIFNKKLIIFIIFFVFPTNILAINIATINDNSIIEFTDSTTTGLGYSYLITTFDENGLYTNSTLETGYSESANPITGPSATDDLSDKIKIS